VEVPLTATFFPYVGTTLRIFPFLTRIQRRFVYWEAVKRGKPVVFDIHPNEFIEEGSGKREIARRSRSFLQFILADRLRARLKIRNLGRPAIPLYRNEMLFYKDKGFRFMRLDEYCRNAGLVK